MQVADLGGEVLRSIGEVDALRRRVVNVVGHALRTPVVTLAGMAEALADADDPAVRAELGAAVRRNARVVERLLDDLLIAAGVTTVLPVGTPEALEPVAVARGWWGAGEADRFEVVEGAEVAAVIDRGALARILDALLTNAARYGDGRVSIGANTGPDGQVVVAIRSRGDRPPTETEVALAFELFYRGEHAVMAAPGLGVGLPVARALAQQAGGDVNLALEPDGTVVATLELPAP